MNSYVLDTGLWCTDPKRFATDKEAWESLRKSLPNKYATLFRYYRIDVPINNRDRYVESHDAKYISQAIGDGPNTLSWKIPVMDGLTSDEWAFDVENLEIIKLED